MGVMESWSRKGTLPEKQATSVKCFKVDYASTIPAVLNWASLGFSHFSPSGTSVIQVTATDADDPTYGNSARVVYSILQGQPYFSVDSKTGI
jgi:hypothetical protein